MKGVPLQARGPQPVLPPISCEQQPGSVSGIESSQEAAITHHRPFFLKVGNLFMSLHLDPKPGSVGLPLRLVMKSQKTQSFTGTAKQRELGRLFWFPGLCWQLMKDREAIEVLQSCREEGDRGPRASSGASPARRSLHPAEGKPSAPRTLPRQLRS